MDIVLVVMAIVCAALAGALVYVVKNTKQKPDDAATMLLKQDLVGLTTSVGDLKESLRQELSGHLGKSQEGMLRQISESTKIVADVSKQLEALKTTNQQVISVTDELKTLQNVLTNPKQRGNVGEIHLETILQNILPPGVFQMQYSFKNGETVDAVIMVDKFIVPIDSKFSLENYNRLIDAKDEATKSLRSAEFKRDIKKRIDETAKYIRPHEKTTDFVFMFIPSEAIYYDLLVNKIGEAGTNSRNLIEYAGTKKVIITSPTTFLAYLQTVMQGLRSMKIEEQAKEIQQRVGDLGRHIAAHEDAMQRLGNSLGTTVGHFNKAHNELAKIDKDVIKIAGGERGVDPMAIDRPSVEQ
ncbi:MAG: DNA recombination protein RmuC [Candidatus Saccharibacteria bacterium]|nr:DNA recombination protein RmuC [Candidatus Saccharibacteria bacterium]